MPNLAFMSFYDLQPKEDQFIPYNGVQTLKSFVWSMVVSFVTFDFKPLATTFTIPLYCNCIENNTANWCLKSHFLLDLIKYDNNKIQIPYLKFNSNLKLTFHWIYWDVYFLVYLVLCLIHVWTSNNLILMLVFIYKGLCEP